MPPPLPPVYGLPMPALLLHFYALLRVPLIASVASLYAAGAICAARLDVAPPAPFSGAAIAGGAVVATPRGAAAVSIHPSANRVGVMMAVLVAELSERRGDVRGGFEGYLRVARAGRDPAVLALATRLGGQMERREVPELARLWANVAPRDAQPHRLLAEGLQRKGAWRAALDEWMRARDLGADERLDTWLAYVSQLEARQRPTPLDAVLVWRQKRPNDHELQRLQAMLMLQGGRVEQALALLERYPVQDEQVLRTRLDAFLALDDAAGARRVIAEAGEQGVDVKEWRKDVADALARTEHFADARFELESLLAARSADAAQMLTLAYVTLRQRDPTRARAVLALVDDSADNHDLRSLYLGEAAELERRWQDALDAYMRVRAGDQFIEARSRAALMLTRLNRLPDARASLAALRLSYPGDAARIYVAEARVLEAAHDVSGAIALLDNALAVRQGNRELRFGRAIARQLAGNSAGGEADLRVLIIRDPNDVKALNALAYSLVTRPAGDSAAAARNANQAMQLINRARRIAPADVDVLHSLGWISYHLGRSEDALRFLREAYRHRRDADVAAHLGEVLWVRGQQAEAQSVWRTGQEVDPQNSAIRQAVQMFRVSRGASGPVNSTTGSSSSASATSGGANQPATQATAKPVVYKNAPVYKNDAR